MFRNRSDPTRSEATTAAGASGTIVLLGIGESGKTTLRHQFAHFAANNTLSQNLSQIRSSSSGADKSKRRSKGRVNKAQSSSTVDPSVILKEIAATPLGDIEAQNTQMHISHVLLGGFNHVANMIASKSKNEIEALSLNTPQIKAALETITNASKRVKMSSLRADSHGLLFRSDVAEAMNILWSLPQIKSLYLDTVNKNNNFEYFAVRLAGYPSYGGDDWVPDFEDYIRAPRATNGVNSRTLTFGSLGLEVIEAAGRPNERKKWQTVLSTLAANTPVSILYVVPVSDFDMICPILGINRLKDALNVFQDLNSSSGSLRNLKKDGVLVNISVVLNKFDLFKNKIVHKGLGVGISEAFSDGPKKGSSFQENLNYIIRLFTMESIDPERTNVFTCNALENTEPYEILKRSINCLTENY